MVPGARGQLSLGLHLSPAGHAVDPLLHSRCKPTLAVAESVDSAKALEMECAEDRQWVGGLIGGHPGGLTMRCQAASLREQLVPDPLLKLARSFPGSCVLVVLLNSLLEHLLRALWVTEKYTLCTFLLFAVG